MTRSTVLELIAAGLAVAWRCAAVPVSALWHDVVLLVALFWIALVLKPKAASWAVVTQTLMAFLMALYCAGQIPRTLEVLGWR